MPALGPLPPAANILRIALSGVKSLQPWANILHAAWSGTTPTVSNLTAIAGDIQTLWDAHMRPVQTVDTALHQVKLTDLTTDTGAQVEAPCDIPGSNGEDPLPSSIAVLIDYPVALRYRGGHPRTYLVAGGDGDLEPGAGDWNTWNPTFLASLGGRWQAFTDGISAISEGGTNVDHLKLVRYIHKPHGGVPAYLIPPEQFDLPSFTTSSTVASQRRRTGRRR